MTAVPPSGAITGQVFFAVLVRDPESGKDVKRRSHLEFQFTKDLTVGDVIEAVSGHVKQNGGRTATSRRSSVLLVFDIQSKQLVPVADRAMRLLAHPVVQVSLKSRGSIALLIDDQRPGRGSFEPQKATPELLRHPSVQAAIASPRSSSSRSQAFSPRIAPAAAADASSPPSVRSANASSTMWARSPSPVTNDNPRQQQQHQQRQRAAVIDPSPHETAKALLEAEMASLRSTRQTGLGYPHWSELLPRTPPTYKRWMKTLERERDAVASHRQTLMREASDAAAASASVTAECARIEKDTRDFEEACLKRARDFDRRALLESKLEDLRATVKEQAATEKELLAAIEQAYVTNSNAARGGSNSSRSGAVERSPPSSSPETRRQQQPTPPSSNVWPSFVVQQQQGNSGAAAASATSSPRSGGAGDPDEVKRAAAEREGYGGRGYTVAAAGRPNLHGGEDEGPEAQALRISSLWGCTPDDLLPSPPASKEGRHGRGVSPDQDRRYGGDATASKANDAHGDDDGDLDSGLRMLPSDLTSDVRALLARSSSERHHHHHHHRRDRESPTSAANDPSDASDNHHHHGSSSIAMRLLASDLDAFLATDGADSESRHALLLRVQELRSRIGGRDSLGGGGRR